MAQNQSKPLLVAVFQNARDASQAYEHLRNTGFGDDYLGMADPLQSGTGLGDTLKNAGVPEDENEFYKHEFNAGHPIVTFRVGGVPQESIEKAIAILREYGAYDMQSKDSRGEGFASDLRTDAKSPFFDLKSGSGENEPR